jgi:nitrate/nitrite transporter NarK
MKLPHRRQFLHLAAGAAALGGFVAPYAIGWIKDATGDITLGLVVLAAGPIMAGLIVILMGHDSKMEMAGSRVMAK